MIHRFSFHNNKTSEYAEDGTVFRLTISVLCSLLSLFIVQTLNKAGHKLVTHSL